MQSQSILIIAHRGASQIVEVENTLKAFNNAIQLRIPMLEFDVRKTKDDRLVCYHDESIQGQKLANLTYTQLLSISQQQGFTVPLLEDTLKLCQNQIKLDIELKEPGYEKQVIDLIQKYFHKDNYIIKSFHDSSILMIKKIDRAITAGLLIGKHRQGFTWQKLSEIFPEYRLLKTQADFISPHYSLLTWGFISRMKLLNKKIYVWTVNDRALGIQLAKKGIFALITDRPDLFLLDNLQLPHLNPITN
jgi:glycerophosphoryl diester phosphodiesterase